MGMMLHRHRKEKEVVAKEVAKKTEKPKKTTSKKG